jgi:uncharacterized protein YyaL (SSP411 family)
MNRLQHETSPYLRQHAANPVDWYPWGDEAFRAAREQDKPILLSIGYSSCHWCHVMAHESFEDDDTAALMNDLFINIKVDREERPDVDSIYMQAVQTMNDGHGGWPLTVFLTPDGKPFYGGTYFPDTPRHGMPAFRQILQGVADAYHLRRDEVEQVGGNLRGALKRDLLAVTSQPEALNADLLNQAFQGFHAEFDWTYGGFGGAPKFPQPMILEFLLRYHVRTGNEAALRMVTQTLTKMARGGIYDQLGGGFARYSVDAMWLVPHFEKMLYDNAQLSRVYLHAYQVTGDDFFRQIAEETYDYVLREMTSPEGGFYSATDADSEGEEGKFFLWTRDELEAILGPEDARLASVYWGVTAHGNFEGKTILNRPNDDAVVAANLALSVEGLHEKIGQIKARLYAARQERVPPGLDDKILTAWNALMLASLAEAARVLERDDYQAEAIKNAHFLLGRMMTAEGRLLRTYKAGEARLNAYLEDYACLADALLALYQTTFEPRYFEEARRLADLAFAHFAAADGGYFDTSDDHEALLVRPRTLQDNAIPAGQSVLAKVGLLLTAYTAKPHYEEAAAGALGLLAGALARVPAAFGEALGAVELHVSGLAEVALIGDPADPAMHAILEAVQRPYRPTAIVALAPEAVPADYPVPLLHDRPLRDGQPTVYVCRNFTCARPVHTAEETAALLAQA